MDDGGLILSIAPGLASVLGFGVGELLGRRLEELVHPDDRSQVFGTVPVPNPEPAQGLEAEGGAAGRSPLPPDEDADAPVPLRVAGVDGWYRWISWTRRPEGFSPGLAVGIETSEDTWARLEARLVAEVTDLDPDLLDDTVLRLCVKHVCRSLGWDYAEVWVPVTGSLLLAVVHDPAGHHRAAQDAVGTARLAAGEGVAGWVWQHRRSWLMGEGDGCPESGGPAASSGADQHRLQAMLAVPVTCEGRVAAVLVWYRVLPPGIRALPGGPAAACWRKRATHFAELSAVHAAHSLERRRAQRRLARVENEARRRADQNEALAALGHHVLGRLGADALVSVALSDLTDLTPASGAAFLKFDETRQLLVVSDAVGTSRGLSQAEVPMAGSLAGRALVAEAGVTCERGMWLDQVQGSVNGMAAPVRTRVGIMGVVEAWGTAPFGAEDLAFLTNLAAAVGHAVDRTTFDVEVLALEERSRRQISEAIHDNPLQIVVAARMRASLLADRLAVGEERTMCEGVADDLGVAVEGLRTLMVELDPGDLSRRGLVAKVTSLLERFRRDFGVETLVEGVLGTEPPAITGATVYRICHEATMNAVKHADPFSVLVSLERRQGGVLARITDDGVGFDPDAVDTCGHLGLESMHQRALRMGGWCQVVSEPSRGTTVTAWIPDRSDLW